MPSKVPYTVNVNEGIKLTNQETGEVVDEGEHTVPAGKYDVESETGSFFTKAADSTELYAVKTINLIGDGDDEADEINVDEAMNVYAGVKVTGNQYTEMSYQSGEEFVKMTAINAESQYTGYVAYGTLITVTHSSRNGVFVAETAGQTYGEEYPAEGMAITEETTFKTGFKVTLGEGVKAGDYENVTLVVVNQEDIDTLAPVVEGMSIIKVTEGKVYAENNVNAETQWSENATLAAATKVTIADGVTLAYRSDDSSTPLKIAAASGDKAVVYVLTDNTLVATNDSDIKVDVEGYTKTIYKDDEGNDVYMITFQITKETTVANVTEAE